MRNQPDQAAVDRLAAAAALDVNPGRRGGSLALELAYAVGRFDGQLAALQSLLEKGGEHANA